MFIGTAAGQRSHQEGAYYAKNGNCFWSAMCDAGLTDRQLQPKEFEILAHLGIGLTDICKKASGVDTRLGDTDFDIDGLVRGCVLSNPASSLLTGRRLRQSTSIAIHGTSTTGDKQGHVTAPT